jgi:hypothetical protein
MHVISIFKILCHVHVDVYLDAEASQVHVVTVQIEFFSRHESNG